MNKLWSQMTASPTLWYIVLGVQDSYLELNLSQTCNMLCLSQNKLFQSHNHQTLKNFNLFIWFVMFVKSAHASAPPQVLSTVVLQRAWEVQEMWGGAQGGIMLCPITTSWHLLTNSSPVPSYYHAIHCKLHHSSQTLSHPHKSHHTHANHITPMQITSHPCKSHHTHMTMVLGVSALHYSTGNSEVVGRIWMLASARALHLTTYYHVPEYFV